MSRNPSTPDCGITDCARAEYRAGLCRKHYAMIPVQDNYARSIAWMLEAHRLGQERRRDAIALVQGRVNAAREREDVSPAKGTGA